MMKQIFRKFRDRSFGLPKTRNFRKILRLEHSDVYLPHKIKLTVTFIESTYDAQRKTTTTIHDDADDDARDDDDDAS